MNMTLVNKIAFNQLNAVVATSPVEVKNDAFNIKVISFVNEMHNFGFLVTKELYQYLSSLDEATSVEVCQKVLSLAKESVGAHVAMKAFYPNFPRQVMEASDAELFINAILHYWTLGAWSPEYVEEKLSLIHI